MDESSFVQQAERSLMQLMTAVEDALGDEAEVDLVGGVLTIAIEGTGTFLLNLHRPNRQIWLSSPRSGAWHFDWHPDGHWVATKGGERLDHLLSREFGHSVSLD